MPESAAPASPTFFLPLWARIAIACFLVAVSAVCMWDEFFRFDWVMFLCLGLLQILLVPMQKDEARKAYLSKPRTIVTTALGIAVVAGALHSLYHVFTKHRF
jgi:hypothetical protein